MFCTKRKFKTEKEAELAIEHIRRVKKKYKREKHPTRTYYCENCKNYHLTSQPASQEPIKLIYIKRFKELIKNRYK